MRTVHALSVISLSLAIVACGDDKPGIDPDGDLPGITITVDTVVAPNLIAFRDGLTGAWQTPVTKTPGTFELAVHGPYFVTIVCDDLLGGFVTVFQYARTPDDDHAIATSCEGTLASNAHLTGHVVQAGEVAYGFSSTGSDIPNWDFDLVEPAGSYDVISTTTDKIAVRRNVAVSGTTALTPAIDIDAQGAAFVPTPLTSDATAAESVRASVLFFTSSSLVFGYRGDPAGAILMPDSVLVPADHHNVTIRATTTAGTTTATRSLRRNFRAGASTAFALPPALGPVQFAVANGALITTWSTLPPNRDAIDVVVDSFSEDGTKSWFHDLEVSNNFAATTSTATLDLDIPGFQPAWRIDLAQQPHDRSVSVFHTDGADLASSNVDESVNAPPFAKPQRRHARTIAKRLLER
jgi:hypothetical protein